MTDARGVRRVAIVGVGLIGGSIGMAAREHLGVEVRGWDPDPRTLRRAVDRGALDVAGEDLESALDGAEVAWVAAPVGVLADAVRRALDAAGSDCVVSDVGSTKRSVVGAASDPRFVGGHPLAGAESAGIEHARADLFVGATWYLTPTDRTSGVLFERLHRTLAGLGARPLAIDPGVHDRLMASVSHLPHVLANVLVDHAARRLEEEGMPLPVAGPSFRDATRVAGSNSAIWTDIYLGNREAIVAAIDDAVARLQAVRRALSDADPEAVTAWNERAGADRQALLAQHAAGGLLHELQVAVPNRPGIVAELALELGRAGIDIVDLVLHPAPDMREGVVGLWIAGDEAAERAQALIEGLEHPVTRA